jgi:hypothetical protein
MSQIAPTQSQVLKQLRSFLLAILPAGTDVVTGQINRVPEPAGANYVVMTPMGQERLRTNVDDYLDVKFTGSIAGTVLTVTNVAFGDILVGATVFGTGVADGTVIQSLGSGTGGVGTYNVNNSQTLTSRTLASGAETFEQGMRINVQLDFHGDLGADMAATASTLFRDAYASQQFASQTPNYGVAPLYADDARQLPFDNDQQQIEWRWVVQAMLQSNVVVSIAQQFADSASIAPKSVDATYPP